MTSKNCRRCPLFETCTFADVMNSDIRIYKFGGASVSGADAVRNVASIIAEQGSKRVVVVVSAMGKITNKLEEILKAYMAGEETSVPFVEMVDYHMSIARELFAPDHEIFAQLNDLFVEIEWVLEEPPQDPYDYVYDQIVSVGEFLSTRIVSAFLQQEGVSNIWLDARDVIKTDNAHREARVDLTLSGELAKTHILPLMDTPGIVVTQGFIGCTSENFTSTLGREGSDYTAALLGSLLEAESVTIWKDVPGIMSADPQEFEGPVKLDRMSYREAIEMTYYGAKVLHTKSIKPLQNRSIPLYVRSFEKPDQEGTHIGSDLHVALPPVIVLAHRQALVHISTKDFSFVAEHHLSDIFGCFARHRIKINLMRNTAISFSVCCKYSERKFEAMRQELQEQFNIEIDRDLKLITIRHADDTAINSLINGKTVIFQERFMDTVQFVVRENVVPQLKQK